VEGVPKISKAHEGKTGRFRSAGSKKRERGGGVRMGGEGNPDWGVEERKRTFQTWARSSEPHSRVWGETAEEKSRRERSRKSASYRGGGGGVNVPKPKKRRFELGGLIYHKAEGKKD